MKRRSNDGRDAACAQVALRLPVDLLRRVDEHAKRMRVAHPGVDVRRSDAMRSLLSTALASAEGGTNKPEGEANTTK